MRWLLASLLIGALLGACEMSGCTPTTTDATDAAAVRVGQVFDSGVLQATLTAGDRALKGKTIVFRAGPRSDEETLGTATTGANGTARFDLKSRPIRLAKTLVAREWSASFTFDGTYCSSSDRASFNLVEQKKT